MGQLIDDLLNLSRVTRHPIRRERVNLSALAEVVASELRKAEPQRQVQFLIEPGLLVDADPNLLRIVLDNLLGNAWKFTRKQPGGRIELGATQHDDQTAYFVWDRGSPRSTD